MMCAYILIIVSFVAELRDLFLIIVDILVCHSDLIRLLLLLIDLSS